MTLFCLREIVYSREVTDGTKSIEKTNTTENVENGEWKYDTPIDKKSVEESSCREGAKYCYIYIKEQIFDGKKLLCATDNVCGVEILKTKKLWG